MALTSYNPQGPAEVFPGYVLVPSGGLVHYVHASGASGLDLLPSGMASPSPGGFFTSLASALGSCRANRGDTIVMLPGHTENVTATSHTWVAGVKVIGQGWGTSTPKLSWTATTSNWAISAANVFITGCVLDLGQANGVTEAITVTASDFTLLQNRIVTTTDATHKATTCLKLGAGADRAHVSLNKFRGAAGTSSTDIVVVSSTGDQIEIIENRFMCAATAANGVIDVSGAATNIMILDNRGMNTVASGTAFIAIADVASSGFIDGNRVGVLNNGTGNAQGIVFAGTGTTTIRCGLNYSDDEAGKSGVLSPAVST